MTYDKALSIMGLQDGEFTYIQLTQIFSTMRKNIPEDKAEELADAYDYIRKNFKKYKTKTSNVDEALFPAIKNIPQEYEVLVNVYPVIRQENGEYQPINIISTPDGKVPSLVVGDFKQGERVYTYLNDKLYSATAYVVDASKVGG